MELYEQPQRPGTKRIGKRVFGSHVIKVGNCLDDGLQILNEAIAKVVAGESMSEIQDYLREKGFSSKDALELCESLFGRFKSQ